VPIAPPLNAARSQTGRQPGAVPSARPGRPRREIELSEFERPTKIRWRELSRNAVTAPERGYDLEPDGDGTKLTFFDELEGHGFGKLIIGLVLRSARTGVDDFVARIKRAVEAG
jgi:hypothetical protein